MTEPNKFRSWFAWKPVKCLTGELVWLRFLWTRIGADGEPQYMTGVPLDMIRQEDIPSKYK
jgi:hypothetical protein